MRKITLLPILISIFTFLLVPASLSLALAKATFDLLPVSGFRELPSLLIALIAFFALVFLEYRAFLAFFPIPEGEIAPGSRAEFRWMVYVAVSLFLFRPLMHSDLIPTPLTRVFYLALGARAGKGSYFAGVLSDPQFTRVGSETYTGLRSVLISHVMEGNRLAHYPIELGDRVTIGAGAIVLPGVRIGDDAIVAALSVVPKNTVIGPGEIWGGNPARLLRSAPVSPLPPR
ncbi:MAG: acyltransferase [Oligoflexia bacterium]|nr:acyltransferase [Oligoflexia bacterium]